MTVTLNAAGNTGSADWWAVVMKPDGNWYYFQPFLQGFQLGLSPTYQGALFDLSSYQVLNSSGLSLGTYTYYFGVDFTVDGSVTMGNVVYDSVVVNVSGSPTPTPAPTPVSSISTLPDTGQTTCYDNSKSITCPSSGQAFYGQDASYSIRPPSYSDNGNGTVTDNVTGLMWQQQDDGKTYNWYEASGTIISTYNPNGATDVCGSLTLGGYSDWRLPSKKELHGITNSEVYGPAIDTTYFPSTNSSFYWSATTYASSTSSAWSVYFYDGSVDGYHKAGTLYARCVRG